MQLINQLLNRYSMLFLMRVYLGFLILYIATLSFTDILFYDPVDLILVSLYLAGVCLVSNWLLAKLFKADTTIDSPLITGLILTLIIGPFTFSASLPILTLLAISAMASKYLLVWRSKHIFNPAALAVMISLIVFDQGASWWVSDIWIFPAVVLGGLLIVQKIDRWRMIGAFLSVYIGLMLLINILQGTDLSTMYSLFERIVLFSPIAFFTFVMLIEPQTSPTTKKQQTIFGILVALLLVFTQNVLAVFYSLELSLLIANLAALGLGASRRFKLQLKSIVDESEDVKSFIFTKPDNLEFTAGQYLEWSLPHSKIDLRGNRRWFSLASSPSEDFVMLSAKFPDKPSSFKKAMLELEPGQYLSATGPEGEFTLDQDNSHGQIVWIAGGIGITPFRSMSKQLRDIGTKRDITLFYVNKDESSTIYKQFLDDIAGSIGLRIVYLYTQSRNKLDVATIKNYVNNYQEASYYLSGPRTMVESFERLLDENGVKKNQIKTDYFPGY
ncbi:MAG: RnfABCDGE type electron transport complex subunit D [Candidatus Saccharimonadales bacterium]